MKTYKRAYLIEIKPTTEQISKIRQTIGVCRYVYNLYISKNKEVYESEGNFLVVMTFPNG